MVARAVALPRGVDAFDVGRADLAVDGGGVEDFVATALDDAGLVHVDMACVGGDDALPGQEDRVDDGGVRLGAADQEVHVGVGGLAGLADQVAGTLAVLVGAVSAGLLHVRGDESLKHPGVRTLLVIAGKVRQRMGRTHAAIIPRSPALRGQTDLRGFPSASTLKPNVPHPRNRSVANQVEHGTHDAPATHLREHDLDER